MGGVGRGRVPASRVLLVACFGAFLAFLDATIVNVAFPSIRASFPGTSISALSWVLNAYNIVFAAFLIVCGRLTDLLGRRRAFIGGIALFTLASVLCGAAPTVGTARRRPRACRPWARRCWCRPRWPWWSRRSPVRGARTRSGCGARRPRVAAGLGPAASAVRSSSWAAGAGRSSSTSRSASRRVLAARSTLVESRAPGRRTMPDLPGAALLAVALALLNLAIIKGGDWGWASPTVLGSFVATAVLVGLFVLSSRRHRSPLLDPALLRIPSFSSPRSRPSSPGSGFYAYLLTNILWLQYVWGYDVLRAGLALVPGALVAAVVAAELGPLAQKHGYRIFVVPGALVWAGAYVWYHQQVGLVPAFWTEWLPGQVLSGIGVGATLPLLGSAALAAVPGGRYATASAVVSSARQLGGVLGIALLVLIIGTPTPATAVAAFRDGWVLSIVAFLAVAVLALPLGRLSSTADEQDEAERAAPVVLLPPPRPAPLAATSRSACPTLPLLAALPAHARHALESATRTVPVPAGSWLIREGDPAGSAYVLRSGRLEVQVGDQVVRELGPGAVLGELALLTGEARSAGVRARRDSTLLEVPRAAFDRMVASDPAAARVVLTQVAEQLRTAGAAATVDQPAQPTVVAVVALDDGESRVAEVAAVLLARLRSHLTVAAPGRGRAGRPGARRAGERPGAARRGRLGRGGGGTSACGRPTRSSWWGTATARRPACPAPPRSTSRTSCCSARCPARPH